MKISCTNPEHNDQNASMEVYEDGGYCFSCGYLDPVAKQPGVRQAPENILETFSYINTLEFKNIRGLELPCNNTGFYIPWPDGTYYKKRFFKGELRYSGPRGHRAPLFKIKGESTSTLILIEGELNALSLSPVIDKKISIASFGSATEALRHLNNYLIYENIWAIFDKDPTGVACGDELRRELRKRGKRVELIAVTQDYNETLQTKGKEGVEQQFKSDVGM